MNEEGKTLNWLKEQSKTCFNDDKILKFIPPKEKVLIDKEEYDRLHNLQSKIDKANELIERKLSTETYQHLKKLYDDIDSTEEIWEDYEFEDLQDILKEDK